MKKKTVIRQMKYILRQFPTEDYLLNLIDATLLQPDITDHEIISFLHDIDMLGFKHVIIPPYYLPLANKITGHIGISLGTVIGFPFGYSLAEVKQHEAALAIQNGADEIDMVINISALKAGCIATVHDEVRLIKETIGNKILKVILETCYLDRKEIGAACLAIKHAKADFIKTSTGFGTAGAQPEDIKLIRQFVGSDIGIKAAGGIKTLHDVSRMVRLGATRIGTSRAISILIEYKDLKRSA